MAGYLIFPLSSDPATREQVNEQLREQWGSPVVAVHGDMYDLSKADGFACREEQTVLGAVHCRLKGEECEVLSLYALREHEGIGQALMRQAVDDARRKGAKRLILTTTNDNTRAIRFYQMLGMNLEALNVDAVERSREWKPVIPLIGCDGIPIRHELRFGMEL